MGIKYLQDENKYQYNFDDNSPKDFIEFTDLPLTPVDLRLNNTYYFGYSFVDNDNAPSKLRTRFFNYFRFENELDVNEKLKFIGNAIDKLNKQIDFYSFDVIVYPKSRSKINQMIISKINNVIGNKTFIDIELTKKLPKEITFDFESWKAEVLTDDKFPGETAKNNAINAIHELLKKIHNSDYFSIAETVKKNKYKRFIGSFLYFENKYIEAIKNSKQILLIDDVSTTGATLFQALKAIRTINHTCKIIIFTVIGKQNLETF